MTDLTTAEAADDSPIAAFAAAGMHPTDDMIPVPWLTRWDAWCGHEEGYLVASETDAEIRLYVLSPSGVVHAEARFDDNRIGRRMFIAAVQVA